MNLHAADVLKKLKDIKKLQKVKQPIGVDTLLLYFNVTPEVLDNLLKELQQEGCVMLTDGRYYQNNKRLAHPKVDLVENAS
jgi:Mn-dependent DtxR family transcriptional regulator